MEEAMDSLLNILDTFGEDIRANEARVDSRRDVASLFPLRS